LYDPGDGYGPSGGGHSSSSSRFFTTLDFLERRKTVVMAHGILASLAFLILFPAGSILIRIASFPGLWWVHGLFQVFSYLLFIAAFGAGVWLVKNAPVSLIGSYHPAIGIVLFCLLFFQPILGWMHHIQFKKYKRRTIWSYGHLWLGRTLIPLGMINGGLGMLLATQTGYFVPTRGQMIAYGVVAGIMWIVWVTASIFGEARRRRAMHARGRRTMRRTV
jgi:hypothetical protein